MRALQTNLSAIPASVFLNKENKSILFVKHGDKNFIDYQDGSDMVVWTRDALCVGDRSYKYNEWNNLEEESPLKHYFSKVLREPLENV